MLNMTKIDDLYEVKPKTYPIKQIGGKFRARKMIVENLKRLYDPHKRIEFREPFAAGAAVTFEVMRSTGIHRYWLNDKDPAIASFWQSVHRNSELINSYLTKGAPSTKDFQVYRQNLMNLKSIPKPMELRVAIGFQKMVVQRLSRSGLGTIATSSCEDISARWNAPGLAKEIDNLSKMMRNNEIKVTNKDFEFIIQENSRRAVLYIDPPYFIRGKGIYQYNMTVEDHIRLCMALKATPHRFVLSYDDLS